MAKVTIFLSTLPARGATGQAAREADGWHFYPRSPRGERRWGSIVSTWPGNFYPRSPRGERLIAQQKALAAEIFLSTLPARGATCPDAGSWNYPADFYPRSPRGERRGTVAKPGRFAKFLSTLPARGATRAPGLCFPGSRYFYPRSPRGERPDKV